MKVVFCWADISGYMSACWRELEQQENINLFVIARHMGSSGSTSFGTDLIHGIPSRLLSSDDISDAELVTKLVVEQDPDIVVICGWCFPAYRALVKVSALKKCRFIMGMDTPLRNTWRQYAGRFLLKDYLTRMDAVFVPGERAWQYARYLGIPEKKIHRGFYGIDFLAFNKSCAIREGQKWPRQFLFVGRYEHIKGIDVLVEAYRKYRQSVADPWNLTCCGKGVMGNLFHEQPGITDAGFVSPKEQPELFAQHGALIMPSRFDPWPLVIVEACASGLPVICTQACGSAVELVRSYHNGLMCATGDVDALVAGMLWIHNNEEGLNSMGRASSGLAVAYSAQVWAKRWQNAFESMG